MISSLLKIKLIRRHDQPREYDPLLLADPNWTLVDYYQQGTKCFGCSWFHPATGRLVFVSNSHKPQLFGHAV